MTSKEREIWLAGKSAGEALGYKEGEEAGKDAGFKEGYAEGLESSKYDDPDFSNYNIYDVLQGLYPDEDELEALVNIIKEYVGDSPFYKMKLEEYLSR